MTATIYRRATLASAVMLFLASAAISCGPTTTAPKSATGEDDGRSFVILAINDVYRIEGTEDGALGGLARVRTLRKELEQTFPDLLFMHAGDALNPSLPSRLYDGAHMIDVLNQLDGDPDGFDDRMFFTIGNHEFDDGDLKDAPTLNQLIKDSQFRWLGTNIKFARGDDGSPLIAADNLIPRTLVESGGVKIGIFGLTTNLAHPEYVKRFGVPELHAIAATKLLRDQGAEVVVALTHLRIERDTRFVTRLGKRGPDVVIGGHEHERQSRIVNGRMIIKADAEAATATVLRVTITDQGSIKATCLTPGGEPDCYYRALDTSVEPDPQVQAKVDSWIQRFDEEFCRDLGKPSDCLNEEMGRTNVKLYAEETLIRRYETNMGNWIADQQRAEYAKYGSQVSLNLSGSIRLNQNIPANSALTRRDVEETFAFPEPLTLFRVKGSTLQKAIEHSVTDWTGNGHWLQVSGIAYRHDPETTTADSLTLLTATGGKTITPDQEILVVVGGYLAGGGDGYTMISEEGEVVPTPQPPPDLKDVVIKALDTAGDAGISPTMEGRICNTHVSEMMDICKAVIADGP